MTAPAPRPPMQRTGTWPSIAVLLATLGCSPTEPSDFLDARLVLDEVVVRSGMTSTGRVEVTNLGSEAVTIEMETCPPRVLLFDGRGDALGQPLVPCALMLTAPTTIRPGETHTHVQAWLASDADGVPLPAGTYRVQVWIVPVGGGSPVVTNRATAEIRPEEPAPTPQRAALSVDPRRALPPGSLRAYYGGRATGAVEAHLRDSPTRELGPRKR